MVAGEAAQDRERSLGAVTVAAMDRVRDVVVLAGEDGIVFWANEAACRLLGYSRSGLTDLCLSRVAPSLAPWLELSALPPSPFECDFLSSAGEPIWLHVTSTRVAEDGRSYLLLTAERAPPPGGSAPAEAVVDAMRRDLFENSPDGLFVLEVFDAENFELIDANAVFARIAGLSPGDARRTGKETLLASPVGAALYPLWRRAIECEGISDQEVLLESEGCWRLFHFRVIPIGEGRRIRRLAGILRDISYREETAELLHVRAEAFRAVAGNSPDVIARYDGEGRRLYLNPAMARLFDRPAADLIGRKITEDSPLTVAQSIEYAAMIRDVFRRGEEFKGEFLFQAAAGGPDRWGHLRVVPEFGPGGDVVSVLAVGREITALKQAQLHLQESRAELRELAARRETAREEERKRIAREMHDELGQLLMGLRLEITLATRYGGDGNGELKASLARMMEVVDRTSQVVRGIVTDLRPVALDIGLVPALEWLASDFEARTDVCCDLCLGEGDLEPEEERAVALFRIVQESLTNVARHAQARHVTITIGRRGERFWLAVRDDGRGFDTAAPRPKSFGLIGMEERALALNGILRVHSAPGEGTLVEVEAPP